MKNDEKLLKITQALADKTVKDTAILTEYKDKEKTKALTTIERLERIERLLGVG